MGCGGELRWVDCLHYQCYHLTDVWDTFDKLYNQ